MKSSLCFSSSVSSAQQPDVVSGYCISWSSSAEQWWLQVFNNHLSLCQDSATQHKKCKGTWDHRSSLPLRRWNEYVVLRSLIKYVFWEKTDVCVCVNVGSRKHCGVRLGVPKSPEGFREELGRDIMWRKWQRLSSRKVQVLGGKSN